ncbi:sigma-70 family RNA polymerase sigma factor [Pseudonocardia xinjiangensis]|uniref:RNA polymerase sigma factor n=1 Tax=Pseudonocardia xinjiangensis TaxID=75289 RepID=A0ABX1RID1_9PSEU|nr:sigma-70 family RNA polymerase sigma factor [Pseudonocardia xinjiangensis]NMH80117.1 sigma-70 family RNA polymerase sigma factor [Pseudonocardia xinjiangensis]
MADGVDDARITAWALAAGRGDRAALAAFVRATQRDVHRFVAHISGPGEAEDLTQETYLRALASLPRFAGRSSARTWLLSIARRTAADAVRTATRRPRTTGVDDWNAVVGERIRSARSAADEAVVLGLLVDQLEPRRREAFVLTQVLDLDYAEAAAVCDCPIGTIRSRVARAREDLMTAMDPVRDSRRRRSGGV